MPWNSISGKVQVLWISSLDYQNVSEFPVLYFVASAQDYEVHLAYAK